MQLAIESFLVETLTEIVRVKVQRIVRKVTKYIADRQLKLNFSARPDGMYETYKRRDKVTGEWVEAYKLIDLKTKSQPGIGPGNNHQHFDLVLVNTIDHRKKR